jgi:hypothetical protein
MAYKSLVTFAMAYKELAIFFSFTIGTIAVITYLGLLQWKLIHYRARQLLIREEQSPGVLSTFHFILADSEKKIENK